MMDSIKIYGKTKEQFGWPDEPPEDFPSASVSNVCPPNLNQGNGTGDTESAAPAAASGTVLERYFHSLSFISPWKRVVVVVGAWVQLCAFPKWENWRELVCCSDCLTKQQLRTLIILVGRLVVALG